MQHLYFLIIKLIEIAIKYMNVELRWNLQSSQLADQQQYKPCKCRAIPLRDLIPTQICSCPHPGSGIPPGYVVAFWLCSMSWDGNRLFVDIGGIVDHHLNFIFIMYGYWLFIFLMTWYQYINFTFTLFPLKIRYCIYVLQSKINFYN